MISPLRFLPAILLVLMLAVPFGPARAQQSGPNSGIGPNFETRLQTLESEMRTLDGRVEEIEYADKQLSQQVQRLQEDTEERLARIESALAAATTTAAAAPAPAPAPAAPAATQVPQAVSNIATTPSETAPTGAPPAPADTDQDQDQDQQPAPAAPVKGTLGSLKTTENGHVIGGTVNPQAPPLPQTPPDYTLTPEEQYDRAFDLLRKADYADAEQAFKSFIDKNPGDRLAYNAKYWYAESLYVQNKYDQAAVAFADAYQADPHGDKAPDDLLDLAKTLAALGKAKDACMTLDSLKLKFPNAPYRVRQNIKDTRAKLKCSAAQ